MSEVDLDNLSTSDLLELGLACHIESAIDVLVSTSEKQAAAIGPVVAEMPTAIPVGVFWNPAIEKVGMYFPRQIDQDVFDMYKEAIASQTQLVVSPRPLAKAHLGDWWVKVAHSPLVRGVGEALQFFPSETIPGFGGRPIASMVATGLLGAGLGYGGGWLAEKLLPERFREKGRLSKTLATVGGLGGAALGSVPGLMNMYVGKSFNAPSLFSGKTHAQRAASTPPPPTLKDLAAPGFEDPLGSNYMNALEKYKADGTLHHVKDAEEMLKCAFGTMGDSNVDLIRTDELGRVLWGSDANPTTTIMAASAMHGASQMHDPRARPGTVTPHQTGLLSLAMGAAGGGIQGYIAGYGAGKALAMLTGLPPAEQQMVANTGLGLGVLNAVVPRLFGM
jgi:hypothetical protein